MTEISTQQVLNAIFGAPEISQQQQQFVDATGADQPRFAYGRLPSEIEVKANLKELGLLPREIHTVTSGVTEIARGIFWKNMEAQAGMVQQLGYAVYTNKPEHPFSTKVVRREGYMETEVGFKAEDIKNIHARVEAKLNGEWAPVLTAPSTPAIVPPAIA